MIVACSATASRRTLSGGSAAFAAAECGIVGLPYDRDVTDDVGTVRGDQARAVWFRVVAQIRPRLGLAIAYPLDEEPDGRL
jgi:hypothetical protein